MRYHFSTVLFCLFGIALSDAVAQPRMQVFAGGSYEKSALIGQSRSNTLQLSPMMGAGLSLDFSKSRITLYAQAGLQRIKADMVRAFWDIDGITETIQIENLKLGPGVQLKFWPNGRIQPFCGLMVFLGLPVRLKYELFGPGVSMPVSLPFYRKIEGGAEVAAGWQANLGIEGKLSEHYRLRLSLASGRHDQNYNWNVNGRMDGAGMLFRGSFWQTSLAIVRDWR